MKSDFLRKIEKEYQNEFKVDPTMTRDYVKEKFSLAVEELVKSTGKPSQRICLAKNHLDKVLYSYDYKKLSTNIQKNWEYLQDKLNYQISSAFDFTKLGPRKECATQDYIRLDYNRFTISNGKSAPTYITAYSVGNCHIAKNILEAIWKIFVYLE